MRNHYYIIKSFSIRPGTDDNGKDYEIKIAALLSLRCMNNASIQNMWLIRNANKCGNFDDIILSYENKDGNNVTYLMQLTLEKEAKTIKRREFLIDKRHFYLSKYYDSMKHIKREIDAESSTKSDVMKHLDRNRNSIVYILFTPRQSPKSDYLISVRETSNAESARSLHKCINTNGQIFSFDYEKLNFKVQNEYRHWMDNFYLFTEQITVDKADAVIQSYIANLIRPTTISKSVMDELYQKFISFLYQWSKGNVGGYYPITRTIILKVLFECLIKPYMWNFEVSKPDNHCDNSFSCVSQSVITVIHSDRVVMQFLKNHLYRIIKEYIDVKEHKVLWKRHPEIISKEILRVTGRYKKITMEVAYEYLWKTNKLPLILKTHVNDSYKLLLQLLKVFHDIFKVIVLTDNIPNTSGNLEICSSLKDLSESNRIFILNYPVRLQNRKFVQLASFVPPEEFHLISIKDVVYILMDRFNIGNSPPPTPKFFIEQSFEAIWMKWDVLKKVIGDKFVIHCRSSEGVNVLLNKAAMSLEEDNISICQPNLPDLSKCRIIIVFNFNEIGEIVKKWHHFSVHFLMFHECLELEWINTCGAHTDISGYRKVRDDQCLNYHRTFAEFHSVVEVMGPECIIISAYPGMGKSAMLAHIANMAPTDRWLLRVNLLDHTSYYKEKLTSVDQIIQYFARSSITNPLAQLVFDFHVKSKNVMLLFDGFDEVPMHLQKKVVKMILKCKDLGCSIYLTTRTNMQPLLEDSLQTFARSITQFSHQDQLQYLTEYFTSNCSSTDELIGNFSRNLLEAASYNLKDHDREFTGIPLQAKLLCQVFKKDCDNYLRTKSFEHKPFDLIYLYKHFIREKFIIVCQKLGKGFEDTLNTLNECRTLYALQLIFLKEDLECLNIDKRLNEILQVLPHHQFQKDGIIIVRNDTEIRFIHRTFAEYLVAKWLSKNVNNERNGKIILSLVRKIFDTNFITVRNMFDRLMAKNRPLHLAIMNLDIDNVKLILKADEHALSLLDRGGRSVFHLIASWGDKSAFPNRKIIDILNFIGKLECNKDGLLSYTPIDYAVASNCLDIGELLCSRLKMLKKCVIHEELYKAISSVGLDTSNHAHLDCVLLIHKVTAELKNLEKQVCTSKQMEAIISGEILAEIPTGHKFHISDECGITPLHLAAVHGRSHIIQALLKQNIDVNASDESGKTPLHWAAVKGHLNVVEVLLSHSANVNKADNDGMTVLHYLFMMNVERDAEIITLLLENHGNLIAKDKYDRTVFFYAFLCNKERYVSHMYDVTTSRHLLLKNLSYDNVIHWAAFAGDEDIVKLLVHFVINGYVGDDYGVIYVNTFKDDEDPIKTLLDSLNLSDDNYERTSSSCSPSLNERPNLVSDLTFNSTNLKVSYKCDWCPLRLVVSNNNTKVGTYLLTASVCITQEMMDILQKAVRSGNEFVLTSLFSILQSSNIMKVDEHCTYIYY
ncbi:hypothetical protein RI129_007798 [Pyrocoelia pectoralis]|uniref:Uncharacterized protein n=1 Tax=Pyrocoelia pectoralis TaxID=417401 RepID=A0AAN7VET5_9COLE